MAASTVAEDLANRLHEFHPEIDLAVPLFDGGHFQEAV
jgi:hypothetical protein